MMSPKIERIKIVLILSLMIILAFSMARGAEIPKAKLPAVITSLGQSPDGYTASLLAKRAKLGIDYNTLLPAKDIPKYKTVIVAVGASLKGFGSAGVNLDSEMKRGKELVKAAKEHKVFLIILHTGGEGRRESMSNMLLNSVADQADYLIVLEAGNEDGYFTKVSKEKKIPLLLVKNIVDIQEIFKEMFSAK